MTAAESCACCDQPAQVWVGRHHGDYVHVCVDCVGDVKKAGDYVVPLTERSCA